MSVRLRGVRFDISFYFFALLTAFFILEPDNVTACGALAAVLHECGHLIAMMTIYGCDVERVRIGACGLCITARMGKERRGWVPICIAGAAVNLALAALFFPLSIISESRFLSIFASANLCIGTVNLLPVEPLDGGQLLRSFLLRATTPEHADKISVSVSIISLIPLIFIGLWLLMRTRFNFSLLFLGLWLLGGILNEYI